MPIRRHFFPNGAVESVIWLPVEPGQSDTFRDISTSRGLGRVVMTSCDPKDRGGVVLLYDSEAKYVATNSLIIPIIELLDEEAQIILDRNDQFELPVKTVDQGTGILKFWHDPTPQLKQIPDITI